ncbi:MAG: glycoside hydrolase family 25 protein [Acidimicrobiales bacterium]
MSHYGIDISSNNAHPIDYQSVTDALRALGAGAQPFVQVKVSEGVGYVNPEAQGDIDGFRAAGAAVAVYTFLDPGTDPRAEVALAVAHADGLPIEIDWESDEPLDDALEALAYSGPLSLLYSSFSYLYDESIPAEKIWLADPNGQPGLVSLSCVEHQYSWTGQVPGLNGPVDMDVWLGTEAGFASAFGLNPPHPHKEDDMLLIQRKSDGNCSLLLNGQRYYIPDTDDLGALQAAVGGLVPLTDAFYNSLPLAPSSAPEGAAPAA